MKQTFTEKFNASKLAYIIKNFDAHKEHIMKTAHSDSDSIKTQINNYLLNSKDGKLNVRYRQNGGQGRMFAVGALSMQGMTRAVRHTIADGLYTDIDIVNCHPVILRYLASKEGWATPHLNNYIENRDEIFSKAKEEHDLDRGDVKRAYLIYTNADNEDPDAPEPPTEHMRLYKEEMRKLHDKFSSKNKEDFAIQCKRLLKAGKTKNHKGSYMNRLLCDMENKILQCMYSFFKKPTDAVLCFDGIMLTAENEYDLTGCEEYVKNRIGIDIKLSAKPFDQVIKTPDNLPPYKEPFTNFISYVKICEGVCSRINIETAKRWMDNSLFYITGTNEGTFVMINDGYDPTTNEVYKKYGMTTHKNLFEMLMRNCRIVNPKYDAEVSKNHRGLSDYKKKQIPYETREKLDKYLYTTLYKFVKDSFMKGEVKTYSNMDIYPYLRNKPNVPDDIYNAFTGFKWLDEKPAPEIDFTKSHIYKHILTDFCNNDMGEFKHLLNHIADIIRDPGHLKGDAHVFYSGQGAGKGMFFELMQKIIGCQYALTINSADRFLKNPFNDLYVFKLLLVFEEAEEGGGAFTMFNNLKRLITGKDDTHEKKRKDATRIHAFNRFWIFTNNSGAVRVEPQNRRFTLHKLSDKHLNDTKYFKPMWEEIANPRFIKAAFDFFANYEEHDPAMCMKPYINTYHREQQAHSLPAGLRFIKSYIEEEYSDCANKIKELKPDNMMFRVPISHFTTEYVARTGNNKTTLKNNIDKLGLTAKKMKNTITNSTTSCYLLYPPHIEELFRTYLGDKEFKFKYMETHVEEDPMEEEIKKAYPDAVFDDEKKSISDEEGNGEDNIALPEDESIYDLPCEEDLIDDLDDEFDDL